MPSPTKLTERVRRNRDSKILKNRNKKLRKGLAKTKKDLEKILAC